MKSNAPSGPATIYDIANLAGVHPSTVSRALTTPGRISAMTEAKIRAAAKELKYVVNPFARALPTGKTKMIAVIVADITNPVFFGVVRGAEAVAAKHGYVLVISESQESSAGEADILQRILPTVDGVMLLTTRLSDEEIQRVNGIKPVILVNREVSGVEDVIPNIAPGIVELSEHLAQLGHKKIAYLAGPSTSWMSKRRWTEIKKDCAKRGLEAFQIGPNPPDLNGGVVALDRILESGATAVVTYNDLMAIGLIRESRKRGLSVPKNLSVIGFDNIFGSDFTSPPLTTIQLPVAELGEQAIETLLTILGQSIPGEKRWESSLTTELLIRESTGKAPN